MPDQDIRKNYAVIINSLAARRLKPAFDQLSRLISENGLVIYADECRSLEETYNYMLKYTVEGVSDPERQKVYRKLIASIFELADKVYNAMRMKISSSIEYDRKRSLRTEPLNDSALLLSDLEQYFLLKQDLGTSELIREKESLEKIRKYFYHIWATDKMTADDSRLFSNFISSPLPPVHYRAFMISAMMLSLQRYFDQEKFMMLFDSCGSVNPEISRRALVSLLINLYRYDSRMPFYPEISERLRLLNDNPAFKESIERVVIQFIRSKETEKLQKRIQEEILPEMIKITPNLRNKINLDSLMEEGLGEDRNPDWEDIFRDSPGLLNKMEEFSEMQMKGDDVFMGSFSRLKSFPFFNEVTNWFMPFSPENPEITGDISLNDEPLREMINAIETAPILCNSDKYSFCFSIRQVPRENLSFMSSAMKAEMEQLREITSDESATDPGKMAEFISNQYIQDLYRFYKLYPRKNDFIDIFGWRLDFHNKHSIGEILRQDTRILRNIAEYYLAKENFQEAAGVYESLPENEKNGELYQKLAWCYQKSGDYEKALGSYIKADLYGVNRLWNLKKTAQCYMHLKKPEKALEYYHEAERLAPDDLGIQLNIGNCLLELERYDDALKCFFKVEYLSPDNKKVWRPIAWCSFLTGKKEQAEKYLNRLIGDAPNKHDLINMGHVQWSMGNRMSALEYYRRSISSTGFTENEFLKVFEEDKPALVSQGVDVDDIPIMLDQLRYFLEEGRT